MENPSARRGPDSFGGRAYHMRQIAAIGTSWCDIADKLDYRPEIPAFVRAHNIMIRAKRYAGRRSLPWPPKRYQIQGDAI